MQIVVRVEASKKQGAAKDLTYILGQGVAPRPKDELDKRLLEHAEGCLAGVEVVWCS